jgi:kynurenine formamidase
MLIDLTLKITPKMVKDAQGNEKTALVGHLGTHFDVMNKVFPLEYTERKAIVFDVSQIGDREIAISDINMEKIEENMFVGFYTGFIKKIDYGTKEYYKDHPHLDVKLINTLLDKNISIIGIDFAGVRRGKEHSPMDQICADRGVFIIENLVNLKSLAESNEYFIANTYPMNYEGMTGLPCRVVAKV